MVRILNLFRGTPLSQATADPDIMDEGQGGLLTFQRTNRTN
jgi:hypothetical protein